MKAILVIIPIMTLFFAIINGSIAEVSSGILESAGEAISLALSLCGVMCFWCGLMKVAENSGLTEKLSALLSAPVSRLFRELKRDGKAIRLISMNLAANILGLGNATTPLGIKAMQAIQEEGGVYEEADNSMILLTVLNTASLQIIPTTAAAMRTAFGAAMPMDIIPCVWICSLYGATVAVSAAKVMGAIHKKRGQK